MPAGFGPAVRGHRKQTPPLQELSADRAVAGGAVQDGGMPADQGGPAPAEHGDLAQAPAAETAKPRSRRSGVQRFHGRSSAGRTVRTRAAHSGVLSRLTLRLIAQTKASLSTPPC